MASTSFTATAVSARRLRNSLNGNPRYRIDFSNGTSMHTKDDSFVNYEVQNLLGPSLDRELEVVVTVERNRIIDLVRVPSETLTR